MGPDKRPCGGAFKMRAEDINRWLRGITLEEDPKKGADNVGEGSNWHLLIGLIQAIWTQGEITATINLGDCGAAPRDAARTTMESAFWSHCGRWWSASWTGN